MGYCGVGGTIIESFLLTDAEGMLAQFSAVPRSWLFHPTTWQRVYPITCWRSSAANLLTIKPNRGPVTSTTRAAVRAISGAGRGGGTTGAYSHCHGDGTRAGDRGLSSKKQPQPILALSIALLAECVVWCTPRARAKGVSLVLRQHKTVGRFWRNCRNVALHQQGLVTIAI